jgi:hypothetical protein
MRLALSEEAKRAVANTSPAQTWAFVCSSRTKTALVVSAHISLALARAEARKLNAIVRMGHVCGEYAETI